MSHLRSTVILPPTRNDVSRRSFLLGAAGLGAAGFGAAADPSGALITSAASVGATRRTYMNPVYHGSMPDPFVLEHKSVYYAFGTTGSARKPDGRCFTVLASTDLVEWRELGGALTPPSGFERGDYWAPEVAHHDGTFFMYYSVGGTATGASEGHQLRVATSREPQGPYRDAGVHLRDPASVFTIDPHPFRDVDGTWYLFYARDFLDSDQGFYPGTALVVDRLVSMTRLAGEPRVVLRARHPWTLFEANRRMSIYNDRVFPQWHTIEGAFVRRHRGKYYLFYSGSNFMTANYGVDYAVADKVSGAYSDRGAESGARVLRSVPNAVRGPGHHSIVTAPDGKSEYVVYHVWDQAMRVRQMCIDKLVWTKRGPRCQPTTTLQPRPLVQ